MTEFILKYDYAQMALARKARKKHFDNCSNVYYKKKNKHPNRNAI